MDLSLVISELRAELQTIEEAIVSLERLARASLWRKGEDLVAAGVIPSPVKRPGRSKRALAEETQLSS
jgi:hypothetical protein